LAQFSHSGLSEGKPEGVPTQPIALRRRPLRKANLGEACKVTFSEVCISKFGRSLKMQALQKFAFRRRQRGVRNATLRFSRRRSPRQRRRVFKGRHSGVGRVTPLYYEGEAREQSL